MNPQMPYGFNPNMMSQQPMMPNYFDYMDNQNSNVSALENKIKELEKRVQAIENKLNMTSSTNLSDSYQSSMYMM